MKVTDKTSHFSLIWGGGYRNKSLSKSLGAAVFLSFGSSGGPLGPLGLLDEQKRSRWRLRIQNSENVPFWVHPPVDLSLKNVLLMARSWWTGRKRRRPEDEGAPVVHVFQGEGRRRLKRTEDRHRWLYFSCAPGGGRLKGQSMASSFLRRRTQTEPATSGVWVVYPGAQRLSRIT